MANSGWMSSAFKHYKLFMLDQRGTGLSTPVDSVTLSNLSPDDQKFILENMRADNIVRDAELIRLSMEELQNAKWTTLGQSFGGFCTTTYINMFPSSLAGCIFTCGLPPVGKTAVEVYHHTAKRMLERNRRFYEAYPQDKNLIRLIVEKLHHQPTTLPSGSTLSAQMFLKYGLELGFTGTFDNLHKALQEAFAVPYESILRRKHQQRSESQSVTEGREEQEPEGKIENRSGYEIALKCTTWKSLPPFSKYFLRIMEATLVHSASAPLYSLIHEAIYCDGEKNSPSDWAASKVISELKEFDYELQLEIENAQINFFGEMIFPWDFDAHEPLRTLGVVAQNLAKKKDWPSLYGNLDELILKSSNIPIAALISYDDIYVDMTLSIETKNKYFPHAKIWITNEYNHSALRDDGANVLKKLIDMLLGTGKIPA